MYDPSTPAVKKQIDEKHDDLVYEISKDNHYSHASYECNKCKVVLFFPKIKDKRLLYK